MIQGLDSEEVKNVAIWIAIGATFLCVYLSNNHKKKK